MQRTRVSCERLANRLVGVHIPQNDVFIVTARSQDRPIRAKGKAGDETCTASERLTTGQMGSHVPQDDSPVRAA